MIEDEGLTESLSEGIDLSVEDDGYYGKWEDYSINIIPTSKGYYCTLFDQDYPAGEGEGLTIEDAFASAKANLEPKENYRN